MTKVNLPDGKGFRDMGITGEGYEIVSEKTTEELVMAELAKHPQAVFQLSANLKMSHQTIDGAVRRLLMQGMVTRKPLTIRIDGRRRNVVEYRLVKK